MSSRDDFGGRVVAEARRWLGTPYVHQASARGAGCDCLGLVRGVWRGVLGPEPFAMPAYAPDWGEVAGEELVLGFARRCMIGIPAPSAMPGDLLVFRWRAGMVAKHLGILTGEARMIHAWERGGVVEVALVPSWSRRVAGVFRFPDPGKD